MICYERVPHTFWIVSRNNADEIIESFGNLRKVDTGLDYDEVEIDGKVNTEHIYWGQVIVRYGKDFRVFSQEQWQKRFIPQQTNINPE